MLSQKRRMSTPLSSFHEVIICAKNKQGSVETLFHMYEKVYCGGTTDCSYVYY